MKVDFFKDNSQDRMQPKPEVALTLYLNDLQSGLNEILAGAFSLSLVLAYVKLAQSAVSEISADTLPKKMPVIK